jgi:hypothetical protein
MAVARKTTILLTIGTNPDEGSQMNAVFISYRRDATAGEARALFQALVGELGHEHVFMDVDNIALGRDFRDVLREQLEACDLMLVLIGRDWAGAKTGSGHLRLEDPEDYVRLEVSTALGRKIPVTPVLVQGAQMPSVEDLPTDIRALTYRNGFELGHTRWDSDVHEMMRRLGLIASYPPPLQPTKSPQQSVKLRRIAVALAFLLAMGGGGVFLYKVQQGAKDQPTPSPAGSSAKEPAIALPGATSGRGQPQPAAAWGVVFGADPSLQSAQPEVERAQKKGFIAAVYNQKGSYHSVVEYPTQNAAQAALDGIQALSATAKSARVLDLTKFCPSPDRSHPGVIECPPE